MAKKATPIPVNTMVNEAGAGIAIEQIAIHELQAADEGQATGFEVVQQSHRHDRHSFFLLHSGTVSLEIDFQQYVIQPSSVIYIHPAQVHRTLTSNDVVVTSLAIDNENLNPEYLPLLEDLVPAKPLPLPSEMFALLSDAASLCIRFSQRKAERLYQPLLKDSCNALVALILSQYLEQAAPASNGSRAGTVTKAFRQLLERNYTTEKRPAAYARLLHLSAPYLNECVKSTTGQPVSYHILQRIILEARRLLYHSDTSVKEIATALGYDDYPYFSRLFTKATGTTAVAFRNKNHDSSNTSPVLPLAAPIVGCCFALSKKGIPQWMLYKIKKYSFRVPAWPGSPLPGG